MRTVLGIDPDGNYRHALDLLARLDFPENSLELVHAVEALVPYVSAYPMPVVTTQAELARGLKEAGRRSVDSALAAARAAGFTAKGQVADGSAQGAILDRADALGADLVALGPTNKGTLDSLLFGSATRGVTQAARQSVLLTRNRPLPAGKLTAVLATDHSVYFDRCLKLLLRLAPRGLGKVVVVHANNERAAEAQLARYDLGHVTDDRATATSADTYSQRNTRIVEHLETAGFGDATSVLVDGDPNAAIQETVDEWKADLLILGAQGHGFFERLLLGSVSAAQIARSPASVLVLRVPPGD